MIMLFLFLILLFFFPQFWRYYSQLKLKHKCKKNKYLVLSFDDGPGVVMTPRLLDLLDRNNVKATFFILGSKVEGNESIIARIIMSGHEVGSHGSDHLNAWQTIPWKAIQDIKNGIDALLKIDIHCRLFRPPYGKVNIITWFYTMHKKLKNCWWTNVSGDTFTKLPCPHCFSIKVINQGGGVVLMHDFDRQESRMNFVLQVTTYLIEWANIKGLTIVTFGELLKSK